MLNSTKQIGVKTNQRSFCRSGHHKPELKTRKHVKWTKWTRRTH